MYLRTPKRYQVGRKPKRHLISTRFLWLWILTPIIAFLGWQVYERREEFGPPVRAFIDNAVISAQSGLSTVTAPTPLPTEDPAQRIARANEAWARGTIEDALNEYEAVLENAPNDVGVHYNMTFGLIMEGRNEEALEMAERTVTANPFSADAWAVRALALDRNNRPAEAIASALQALSLDAENVRAMAFMAEAYLDANRPELAETTINRALEADPNSFEANYVNALYLTNSAFDFAGARDALQLAQDIAPNLPYIAIQLAWTEINLQNVDGALEILQEVLELNPQNLDALYAISYLYSWGYGDSQQALGYVEQCTRIDPENRACLSHQGTLQDYNGDSQGALQTYQQLIRTGTTNPRHFLAAGQAYLGAGQCDSAVTMFQQGYDLERDTDVPDTELLATLETLMIQCGADITPAFSGDAEATPEAGLEGDAVDETADEGQ